MRHTHEVQGIRALGWFVVLVVAAFAHAAGALAQVYKCTDVDGRTAYSDKPCATQPGAAGGAAAGRDGVKQEALRLQKPAVASTGADAISAMCARYEGSKVTDATIQSLPEAQRNAVIAALRGVMAGMARDPGAQEALKRVTLHVDPSRNAVICVPRPRAQSPGAPAVSTFVAHRIEPNGRMETLQPGAPPQVSNDANEPVTLAGRCAALVTACVRATAPRQPSAANQSLDECFDKQPACPAGSLDPALSCCPQTCKDAYRRERSRGTDAQTATIKVIFGDDAGTPSCVPGMPRRN